MIRILIADDHKKYREALKSILIEEPTFYVVDEATNGKEAIDKISNMNVDVIIMDINMPVMNGFEATQYLKINHSQVKVLIHSSINEHIYMVKIFEVGATGYLVKGTSREELIFAIKEVANGNTFICSAMDIQP